MTTGMAAPRSVAIALPAVLLAALLATPVRADDEPPMPAPQPPYPQPMYPAPLTQTTQSTFVPQSVALSGPAEIEDFDFSRPVPLGYTPIARSNKHLIVAGAVTFGVVYSISLLTAAAGEDASDGGRNSVASLWIPVAGPFLQAGQTDSAFGKVFLFGAGGAQLAGALMLYYGMSSKQHVLVRNDLVGSLTVAPLAGNGASGMAVAGRF